MSISEDCNCEKLERVLQLFLQPNFNVVSVTYLDLLLTHVKDNIIKGDQKVSQIVQDWLIAALNKWNDNCIPSQNLVTFTIKLIGLISVNEVIFLRLSQNDLHNKICHLFGLQQVSLSASIKMSFATMLVNLLEHESGRLWIEKTGSWKEVVRFAQQNHTMYVTRESQKFLAKLLVLEIKNKNLCKEIILMTSDPLVKVTVDSQTINGSLDHLLPLITNRQLHNEQMNLLQSTIELLLNIIEYATYYDLKNSVYKMFEDFVSIESRVKIVYEAVINTPMVRIVQKLVLLLIFAKLRSSIKESEEILDNKPYREMVYDLYKHSMSLLSKDLIIEFVMSKKFIFEYWMRLMKIKRIQVPNVYRFEDQNIALMILPLTATFKPGYVKEHYLFEQFINKMFDITCTNVQRLAYAVRDIILKKDLPLEKMCVMTVNSLLEMADIMDRQVVVLVFQVICHSLKNFITENDPEKSSSSNTNSNLSDKTNGDSNNCGPKRLVRNSFLDGDPINSKQTLLAALLNALNFFTEKYKLKWQECVETICILSIAQDVLNHPGVDSKICILALKTCKLSIQNFMPPNLALLVDFDEYTKQIGPTLFKRIHDTNWEVQDSTLEILNTIACISENKYPPYKNFLLENHFLEVAIEIIKSQSESYVRASALTFISTSVKINTLWEKVLNQSNLMDIAIKIIYTESEAIVRREAVVLLKSLYTYRKWPKEAINVMTNAMTVAAVLDLHWEVKVNALEFWKSFIKSHLTDQGMLDGHFPTVTFSKQNKKIVSLDAIEIKERLNKALDELSQQQCLGVLLVTLKDESDFEVAKTSAKIINDLRQILLEYKIEEPKQPSPSLKDTPTIDSKYIKRPLENQIQSTAYNNKAPDTVIESIVDATDANLLAAIYNVTMKMDENLEDTIDKKNGKETLEYIKKITRNEFLKTILKFDFDGYIKERNEWLQNHAISFNSILDDILTISDQKEINAMDCY